MTDRRYSEEEMALILKRAVESQRTTNLPATGSTEGFSLTEMQEIGKDVGIEPARIAAAARSLEAASAATSKPRGIRKPRFERWVPKVADTEDLQNLTGLTRRTMNHDGDATQVFGDVEWRGRTAVGKTRVSIRPEAGGTKIEASGNFNEAVLGALIGTMPVGGFMFLGLGFEAGVSPPVGLLMAGLGLVAGGLPWLLGIRSARKRLARTAAELETHLLKHGQDPVDEDIEVS